MRCITAQMSSRYQEKTRSFAVLLQNFSPLTHSWSELLKLIYYKYIGLGVIEVATQQHCSVRSDQPASSPPRRSRRDDLAGEHYHASQNADECDEQQFKQRVHRQMLLVSGRKFFAFLNVDTYTYQR